MRDETEGEGAGVGEPDGDPAPAMREFMERGLWRLLLEGALGAGGGVLLASLVPEGEGRGALFAAVGAVAAPLALLLTPTRGSVFVRGVRYGVALAVLLTLLVSFTMGDAILLEELLAFGLFIFAIGAVGHAVVAASLGGKHLPNG